MTKEEVTRLEIIISRNLRTLSKMVSKDLGIRLPRLKFFTYIDIDSSREGLIYWLYLKPKNKAILRKCRRNKLLSTIFDDVTIDGLCRYYSNTKVSVNFELKITAGTEHFKLNAGMYEITVDDNGEEITTRSITRI